MRVVVYMGGRYHLLWMCVNSPKARENTQPSAVLVDFFCWSQLKLQEGSIGKVLAAEFVFGASYL